MLGVIAIICLIIFPPNSLFISPIIFLLLTMGSGLPTL